MVNFSALRTYANPNVRSAADAHQHAHHQVQRHRRTGQRELHRPAGARGKGVR